MKRSKFYFPILISSVMILGLQPVWAGKEEYDIPCVRQVFINPTPIPYQIPPSSELCRETVHVTRYVPDNHENKDAPAVVFFHGGPDIKNQGQFEGFAAQFIAHGYRVYVPEIIGSSYYRTNGQDANEYKKNYVTDIQAILNHMKEETSGEMYAIAHSLGCHQLFHFMAEPSSIFDFKAICAIAGPWDRKASLEGPIQSGRLGMGSATMKACTDFVGYYTQLEGSEAPMTESHNYLVNEDLNKNLSVLYHMEKLKNIPPVLLMHAKDDMAVPFDISLRMLKALRQNESKVSGYFLETGDHGFIKNPINETVDTNVEKREKAISNMLNFFGTSTEMIYLDDQEIEFNELSKS